MVNDGYVSGYHPDDEIKRAQSQDMIDFILAEAEAFRKKEAANATQLTIFLIQAETLENMAKTLELNFL